MSSLLTQWNKNMLSLKVNKSWILRILSKKKNLWYRRKPWNRIRCDIIILIYTENVLLHHIVQLRSYSYYETGFCYPVLSLFWSWPPTIKNYNMRGQLRKLVTDSVSSSTAYTGFVCLDWYDVLPLAQS